MEDGRQQVVEVGLEEPPAQRRIIKRPRLTKLLDEADARIILLIAPAGYGKTTLAREWTSQRGRRALWYRARTGASDVAVVARGLSVALAPLSPSIERSVREMLAALSTPEDEPEAIADLLAAELDGWPIGTWLVIDEYELAPQGAPMKLVERFVQISGAGVLITSRERPRWIEPRDLLYGDAFELRQAALSMTLDEASRVLESATQVPAGLVALADGWPAVIGLAALLPGVVNPTSDVQSALFDYVAQELFDGLDPDVQRHLVLLSVPSTLSHTTVRAVAGENADRVLRDSVRAGLTTIRDHEIEIHPLCRAFLGRKLMDIAVLDERLDALSDHLIDAGHWDDAFEVIRRFDLKTHLPVVIGRGLRSVLSEGRVATVERWVAAAETYGLEEPELALARAEIYLRRGDWRLSETLASSCAPALKSSHLTAQAYLCAGAAAHFLDAEKRSDRYYADALKHDDAMETRRRALWGRFLASAHGERREVYFGALTALEKLQDSTPEHLLRLHLAKLAVSRREGNISEASIVALSAEPLLEHVEDPFVRSGFMEALADSLNSAARYDEGGRVAELELAESKRFRLTFVLPMALANLAAAKVGSGDYTAASTLIERSESEDNTRDEFTRLKRRIVLARLWLCRNEPATAADILSREGMGGIRPDMMGEALATRALAEACANDFSSCQRSVAETASVVGYLAPRVLLAATRAILALQSGEITEALNDFARDVTRTGYFDSAVCSLRAHPQLLNESARHAAMIDVIRVAASRSGDATLASAIGDTSLIAARKQPLSSREREVLQLAAQGFRNDQIGRRLFISPMTVKTHLHNIYEKLEVKSRTEAAIKAKDAGLLR
jgi:LuxR family maltose regulon positive regulatory protein